MDYVKAFEDLQWRYAVVCQALRIAGKYSRTNLPAEMVVNADGSMDKEYLTILVNGSGRDPEGKEYLEKWLHDAEQELKHMQDEF